MNDFWLTFAQLTVNGIAVGAIYALVALGLVLIYKATEVLNFAHGDLLVVSAFSAWGLITVWGLPFWLALMITVLGVALFAFALDALVIRRIAGQPQFAGVMLTIALAFMIRGAVSMLFGPESRNYPTPWSQQSTQLAGLSIANLQLVILGVSMMVTLVLFFFFRFTRLGSTPWSGPWAASRQPLQVCCWRPSLWWTSVCGLSPSRPCRPWCWAALAAFRARLWAGF
jgi:branched-chain amino acid transport system permease protein